MSMNRDTTSPCSEPSLPGNAVKTSGSPQLLESPSVTGSADPLCGSSVEAKVTGVPSHQADKFPALPSKKLVGKNMAVPPSNKEWANGVCGRLNMTTSSFKEKAPHQSKSHGANAPTWAEALFEKKSSPKKSEASKLPKKQCYTTKKRSKKNRTKVDAGMEMPTKATEVDDSVIEPNEAPEVSEETNVDVGMEKLFVAGEVAKAKNGDDGMVEPIEATEVDAGVTKPNEAPEVSEETNVEDSMKKPFVTAGFNVEITQPNEAAEVSKEANAVAGMILPDMAVEVSKESNIDDDGLRKPSMATGVSHEFQVDDGIVKSTNVLKETDVDTSNIEPNGAAVAFQETRVDNGIKPNVPAEVSKGKPRPPKHRSRKNKKRSRKTKRSNSSCCIQPEKSNEKGQQNIFEASTEAELITKLAFDIEIPENFDWAESGARTDAGDDDFFAHFEIKSNGEVNGEKSETSSIRRINVVEVAEDIGRLDAPEITEVGVAGDVALLECNDEKYEISNTSSVCAAEDVQDTMRLQTIEEIDTLSVDTEKVKFFLCLETIEEVDTPGIDEEVQFNTHLEASGMVNIPSKDAAQSIVQFGVGGTCENRRVDVEASRTNTQLPGIEIATGPCIDDAEVAESSMNLNESIWTSNNSFADVEATKIILQLLDIAPDIDQEAGESTQLEVSETFDMSRDVVHQDISPFEAVEEAEHLSVDFAEYGKALMHLEVSEIKTTTFEGALQIKERETPQTTNAPVYCSLGSNMDLEVHKEADNIDNYDPSGFIELEAYEEHDTPVNRCSLSLDIINGAVENSGEHSFEFATEEASYPSFGFARDLTLLSLVVFLVWSIKTSIILKSCLVIYFFQPKVIESTSNPSLSQEDQTKKQLEAIELENNSNDFREEQDNLHLEANGTTRCPCYGLLWDITLIGLVFLLVWVLSGSITLKTCLFCFLVRPEVDRKVSYPGKHDQHPQGMVNLEDDNTVYRSSLSKENRFYFKYYPSFGLFLNNSEQGITIDADAEARDIDFKNLSMEETNSAFVKRTLNSDDEVLDNKTLTRTIGLFQIDHSTECQALQNDSPKLELVEYIDFPEKLETQLFHKLLSTDFDENLGGSFQRESGFQERTSQALFNALNDAFFEASIFNLTSDLPEGQINLQTSRSSLHSGQFSNGSTSPTKLSLRRFKTNETSATSADNCDQGHDKYFLLMAHQSIYALELDTIYQNIPNPESKLDLARCCGAYSKARVGGLEPRSATNNSIQFGILLVVVFQLIVLLVDCGISRTSTPRFPNRCLWIAFSVVSWILSR
ncbi:uncharacterized protein CANTADRAFT_26444 [Suhomyces tanzawaensis NRRL Y-17324]|uniref:Uncharacterized protein n=1 Tax=Suhomyces tanzawaensis NRRL Y-17324 TaxID=984487 RepID=A0A1E4SFN5_9ASCO|nr:uncharacterized protein CANTADRAFT_26444 [Suhomyces tanzawaensis NRRL Y-17324]ODV78275.1 hypothetical protein CANTADRAFT_26444 [Suhomyces tanzawaensis NRRL Y-17324]